MARWRAMIGPRFAVVLGVALLAFLLVAVGYVVWIRLVGLEPTLAQRYVARSRPVRMVLAVLFGTALGAGIQAMPTVEAGVLGVVALAAATFAGLILFEVVQYRDARLPSDASARAASGE